MGLRLSMMVFAAAIILFSLFSFGYERETALIIFVIGLCKITESLSDIIFGRLQKEKRLDRIALSLIFQGPISLVLFSILLWLTGSLLFGLLGIFISRLSLLIVYDIANVKKYARFHPNFSLQTLTHLFKFSIPLGFVQLFISLYLNIPRYFLESYHGEEILGYFSAIAYILVAGDTIISALSQAASPQLANLFHLGKKRSFLRLFMRLVLIAIGLGFAGILFIFLFGPEILLILYQADYMQFNNIFLLLMFASTLNYVGWFMEAAMTATGRFKEQLYISFLWVITSVISSILLIPDLGIKGAAYALIITASVQLLSKLLVLILIYKSERTN